MLEFTSYIHRSTLCPAVIDSRIEIFRVGLTDVYFLDANQDLENAALKAGVHIDEWQLAGNMKSAGRRADFLRARWLIRQVLPSTSAILPTRSGQPNWPKPITGSITHKGGHVAVAVSKQSRCADSANHIGIDLERLKPLSSGAAKKVLTETEIANQEIWAHELSIAGELIPTMIFCVKEALYKTCFPPTGVEFYFHDAEVMSFDRPWNSLLHMRAIHCQVRLKKNLGCGFSPSRTFDCALIPIKKQESAFILAAIAVT